MSLAKLQDLSGRVALVTGGSRGLGLQMAEVLAELGAKVAITARKAAELEEAREHLRALGAVAVPTVSDMGNLAGIGAMVVETVEKCGPIDILINNAGTTWGAPTLEHPLEAWNKVITLNLSAIFVASQEVGKRCMVPRKSGKIINVASIQGLSGGYPIGAPTISYNASKGGVVNMTRMLAKEWAPFNINVNAIAPGYFESKMTKTVYEQQAELAPMKRTGGPEDLKGVTALLASDACAFLTGQIIAVDGGVTAAF
jgi:NAD(P)-dependent dehydrogenase (short-subunit alcohol dehydrogenase family)